MSLRNLNPTVSRPAILRDFELAFKGEAGMGTVIEKAGGHLHGVVHTITQREMLMLDKIESGYDRLTVTAEFYDGSKGPATVYKFKPDLLAKSMWALFCLQIESVLHLCMRVALMGSGPDGLPSERYLDIIIRGCVHHKVDSKWIDWLKTVKVVPRKTQAELKTYPDPPAGKTMTPAGVFGRGFAFLSTRLYNLTCFLLRRAGQVRRARRPAALLRVELQRCVSHPTSIRFCLLVALLTPFVCCVCSVEVGCGPEGFEGASDADSEPVRGPRGRVCYEPELV
jgi:hypothetical protein